MEETKTTEDTKVCYVCGGTEPEEELVFYNGPDDSAWAHEICQENLQSKYGYDTYDKETGEFLT